MNYFTNNTAWFILCIGLTLLNIFDITDWGDVYDVEDINIIYDEETGFDNYEFVVFSVYDTYVVDLSNVRIISESSGDTVYFSSHTDLQQWIGDVTHYDATFADSLIQSLVIMQDYYIVHDTLTFKSK